MQWDSEGGSRVWGPRAVAAKLAVVAALVTAATGCGTAGPASPSAQGQAEVGSGCVADPGAQHQDVEGNDYEAPWPHTPGQEVTVYFQTQGLPQRYADFARTGAEIWSRSPCVRAIAVDKCPERVSCSKVTTEVRADDDGTDGNSDSKDRDGVRLANTLTLYTGLLDEAPDSGALATTVHEMGHALGLMHRKDKDSVMYADTIDKTNAIPDAIDYANLVVVYGGGRSGQ